MFCEGISGIKTHRDSVLTDFDRASLKKRFTDIATNNDEDQLKRRYGIEDTNYWTLSEARKHITADSVPKMVRRYFYRPFDWRYVYYNKDIIERGDARWSVMKHMLNENVALLAMRQVVGPEYSHFGVSKALVDNRVFSSNRGIPVAFPLYLYTTPEDTEGTLFATERITREPNFSQQFIAAVEQTMNLRFTTGGEGDLRKSIGPQDILYYAYAVFHSRTYRERYSEFLEIDFPRLPLTSDRELFKALVEKGEELVVLHLMESPKLKESSVRFDKEGSGLVISRHPRYVPPGKTAPETDETLRRGRVYINKTQYFEGIEPDVWEFEIGGYQVLHKWLKDRKRADYPLSYDDVEHYRRMVVALEETMRLMEEIDETIPQWPIE